MNESLQIASRETREVHSLFERKVKIESGMTIGHISLSLGMKSASWLDSTLRNPVEKNTYVNSKDPIKPAKHEELYRWGEPRLGDEYRLIKFNGEFQLHRKRGNESIFMIIPAEQVQQTDEIKKIAELTSSQLTQLNSDIQSA